MSAQALSESESIVFFGSGPVAAESLNLLAMHQTIEAVITKPQPPHHKQPFPVLVMAEQLGIPVYTPNSRAELSELIANTPFGSQLGVVIDYGFIINQDVIDYFPLGIVNSHFSLLPELRGADPISFAILSGQAETGVSLMLIVAAMDEGPILAQTTYAIPPDATTPKLTEALIAVSDDALQRILPDYFAGNLLARPQDEVAFPDHTETTYTRKLTKADGVLDFTKSAIQLEREIRAFTDWPASRTTVGDKDVIIVSAHVVSQVHSAIPGTVWRDGKQFGFYTSDGVLVVDQIKPAGKPTMSAEAFVAGYSSILD